MMATGLRRGGKVLLATCAVLFLLFAALTAYQRFYAERDATMTTPACGRNSATAVLIEEEPPATADWPQWRGPRRDGVAHFPDLLTTWPARGPTRLWQAAGGEGFSSFAVADGRACTLVRQNNREIVLCWGVNDGKEQWRFAHNIPSQGQYPGPRSTPVIEGSRIYTVGAAGLLACLDAANGQAVWKHNLRGS